MTKTSLPIGILGGMFDPVHFGHLRSAVEVYQALELEKLVFIPCHHPPHREPATASAAARLAMLKLAIQGDEHLEIDSCELQKHSRSYTVDTLHLLRKKWHERSLCLIIGSDAFLQLATWHQWQQLFELAHIVVLHRPGWAVNDCIPTVLKPILTQRQTFKLTDIQTKAYGHIWLQAVTALSISSTQIRELLSRGQSARFLLPDNVLNYIHQQDLYTHAKN